MARWKCESARELLTLYLVNESLFLCLSWQLPVPVAVLALMYHERLMPCSSNSPRLLGASSLPSPAVDSRHGNAHMCVFVTTLFQWNGDHLSPFLSPGHGSLFACCNPAKLQGRPATFFILHILGGAILFITDGIIVRFTPTHTHKLFIFSF